MGERTFTAHAYEATRRSVRSEGGSATYRGEQRHREGKGLDPLVDPKGFGGIRRSISRKDKKGSHFVLTVGTAMLKETRFDTTGSMGGNVQLAFDALPRSYSLIKEIGAAPLARYDVQVINSIFADVRDDYVLCRSQAEMDEKIAEQLRLMVPEKDGHDEDEDPQYGLFGAAYLTAAEAVKLGLKTYDFTVTDARGRPRLDPGTLVRVFGDEVFDRVRDNGHQMRKSDLPTTKEVVQDLLRISHAFVIQVDNKVHVNEFWSGMFGSNRVIIVPDVTFLPEVEAVIIGLTEGTLDLQSVKDFLLDEAKIDQLVGRRGDAEEVASSIQRAVAKIPLGAQQALPNFDRIPLKGAKFRTKTDLWPIDSDESEEDSEAESGKEKPGKKKIWL